MKYIGILILSLCVCSCGDPEIDRELPQARSEVLDAEPQNPQSAIKLQDCRHNLRQSVGLLLSTEVAVKRGHVTFYNQDGSPWYTFKFNKETEEVLDEVGKDFQPFRYSSSDEYVVLNVVENRGELLGVIVNESDGTIKYVKKADPGFRPQSWEQYVLDCFAVGFDHIANPLRAAPESDSFINFESKTQFFHPIKIQGEWLRVEWFKDNDRSKQRNTGWVRWKTTDELLIRLFETA